MKHAQYCEACGGPALLLLDGGEHIVCDPTCALALGRRLERALLQPRIAELAEQVLAQGRRIEALQTVICDQVVSELSKLREQKGKPT